MSLHETLIGESGQDGSWAAPAIRPSLQDIVRDYEAKRDGLEAQIAAFNTATDTVKSASVTVIDASCQTVIRRHDQEWPDLGTMPTLPRKLGAHIRRTIAGEYDDRDPNPMWSSIPRGGSPLSG